MNVSALDFYVVYFGYASLDMYRYFVADNVLDEIIFGWPRQKSGVQLREVLATRLHKAMKSVFNLKRSEKTY